VNREARNEALRVQELFYPTEGESAQSDIPGRSEPLFYVNFKRDTIWLVNFPDDSLYPGPWRDCSQSPRLRTVSMASCSQSTFSAIPTLALSIKWWVRVTAEQKTGYSLGRALSFMMKQLHDNGVTELFVINEGLALKQNKEIVFRESSISPSKFITEPATVEMRRELNLNWEGRGEVTEDMLRYMVDIHKKKNQKLIDCKILAYALKI
jgi:hypothetical protein